MWGDWEYLSPRRHAEDRCVFLQARSLCKSNVWRICLWFHFRRFVLVPWLPIKLKNNNSWSKPSENLHQRGLRGLGLHLWAITALQYHCTFYTPRQPGHLVPQNSNWKTDMVLILVLSTHTTPGAWSLILILALISQLWLPIPAFQTSSKGVIPHPLMNEWAGTSETRSRNPWFPHAYIWPLEGSAGPAKSLGVLLHLRPHLGRHWRI